MIQRNRVAVADQPLLQMRQVSKRFVMHHEKQRSFQESFIRFVQRKRDRGRQFWALNDVSLEVHAGDCFGIVGSNGSGKSTLLKLITGIVQPTNGNVITNGRIASLLELGAGFHPELTGRENIFLNGSVFGLSRRQMLKRLDEIIDFTELGDFIDTPIKHYSSGMYVRLGFAVAIHIDPDLLLVDEVLAVGDAAFQHKCLDRIGKFRGQGGTLMFVSHDLETVQTLCNKAIWLEDGQVRAAGGPTDVAMAYLNGVADREESTAEGAQALVEARPHWGTGKVRILEVKLCDDTGTPRYIFATGGAMEVRLRYRVEGRVEEPVFGIAIHHQNGAHLCGPNTDLGGLRIPALMGEGHLVYRIPALPLLEGAYVISAAVVARGDTETYDYHDRAYPFRVLNSASRERYGVVMLGGEWQITPDSAIPQI
jgi:lipopolysaccharide transport system ATP-binding protein